MPNIYIAPLQETYSEALSPAMTKEKCLKKLAEGRHIVPVQQAQHKVCPFQMDGPITEKAQH